MLARTILSYSTTHGIRLMYRPLTKATFAPVLTYSFSHLNQKHWNNYPMVGTQKKLYSMDSGRKPRDDQLPPLMDHPYWTFSRSRDKRQQFEQIKNEKNKEYIMSQLDPKFSLEEFKQGAESTFLTVSNILGSNDISTLKDDGLIDSKAFNEIQFNLDKFTQKQRLIFRTSKELLRGTNVHQIGIIEESGLKAVEIMVVFTVMPFSAEEFSVKEMTPMELMRNVVLCNYQFYRDYTDKDNPSDWIINVVNHFYPLPPPST